jgi:hypothetical protein
MTKPITAEQLIELLKTIPPETIITCIQEQIGGFGISTTWIECESYAQEGVPLTLERITGIEYFPPSPYHLKGTLYFGEK